MGASSSSGFQMRNEELSGDEREFAAAGFTLKEGSDDDDFPVSDESDDEDLADDDLPEEADLDDVDLDD